MKVSVIGVGKVGYPMALFFRSLGYDVSVFDKNPGVMGALRDGKNPYPWESTLDAGGQPLVVTPGNTLAETLYGASFVFIVVATPQKGTYLSSDYVVSALNEIEAVVRARPGMERLLVSVVSTLDPRDTKAVCAPRKLFDVVYNPPLIRLGNVRNDFENTRIFFLGGERTLLDRVENLYYPNGTPANVSVIRGDHVTIAAAKLAVNASRSMRVAWANDIAAKCEVLGANHKVVLDAVGPDPRSGNTFMHKGPPPGGPCLPRDMDVWADLQSPSNLAAAVLKTHSVTTETIMAGVKDWVTALGRASPKLAILGVAYNPKGLDVTNSIGLAIARFSLEFGWEARVHDPSREFIQSMCSDVNLEADSELESMLSWADAVIVSTLWDQYREIKVTKPKLVLDWRS